MVLSLRLEFVSSIFDFSLDNDVCYSAMEEPGSTIVHNGAEEKALKPLVDAFGVMFTQKEIASAFREAGMDADAAGLILLQPSNDADVHSVPDSDVSDDLSSKSSFQDMSLEPTQSNDISKSSKLKNPPASVGTVSSFLGKDYVRAKPSARSFYGATKPLKLDPETLPESAIWDKKDETENKEWMHKGMEDFLFKMLGHGFELDRDTIREVLGKCGYDMQKSMDRLFDYSASAFQKKSRQESTLKYNERNSRAGGISQQQKIQPSGKQDRDNLQKEVLAALFVPPERHEDLPNIAATKKSAVPLVAIESAEKLVESPEKLTPVNESNMANSNQDNYGDDEEGSYQALRKAVQEYRNTMKEYYSAAIEAFQAGDHVRANKCLEKGSFFQQKARKADDESAEKIFETSKNVDTQDSMTLDLHDCEPREAIRLLRNHLSSLAGSPAFKHLIVIIETADEDTSKGARRQRIMKLLEGDSLEWKEEDTAGTILIPLERIDRRRLSFVKK